MTPVKEPKEYNQIFRKVLFQVLIDPTRAKLLKDICDEKGERPNVILRQLAYEFIEENAASGSYNEAKNEDIRLMNKAQQSRIDNGFNWTKE